MNKYLTCTQVGALINFYVEGKLNPALREYVELHLQKCPHCRRKVQDLRNILLKYNSLKETNIQIDQKLDENFVNNLSAYIDNELNSEENIKIKKMTISNPGARKQLEKIYKFQKLLQASYEKTKNDNKIDLSKNVMSKISGDDYYVTAYFKNIVILFAIIICAIICGFLYLYF